MDDTNGAQLGPANVGVGESPAEQVVQRTTLARERMIEVIANNKLVVKDCEKILEVLNADPTLDSSFCRIFGISPKGSVRDVSRG